MPEVGNMPIPRQIAREGVIDMVRVSDARKSWTALGTVVMHVFPESEAGGPLSLAATGDLVRLDTQNGMLDLVVPERELAQRRKE